MKTFRFLILAALGFSATFSISASAAEVFATPEQSGKSGAATYRLTAFVDEPVDAISFVFTLPAGAEKVSLDKCGPASKEGLIARCYFEPLTRKLAVAALRADGGSLQPKEYDFGVLTLGSYRGPKLSPLQIHDVTTANGMYPDAGGGRQQADSTSQEH